MGKRSFYWLWAKRTFHLSFGWGDLAGSIVGNVLTAFAHLAPSWSTTVSDLLWQIPIFSLAGAVLLRLFLAPYELWKEQKDRADTHATERDFDVNLWAGEEVLRLYQAACLWVEKSPPASSGDTLPVEARPVLQRLKRAITNRSLSFHDDEDGKKWLWTCAQPVSMVLGVKASTPIEISNRAEVDRAGLRAYAEQLNERPRFLFGEA